MRAIEGAARFLSAGQSQLDGAKRPELLLLVAHERIDPDGRLRFVVRGSAGVEVAVLLDELEWIACPVLALRLDDIQVRQKQNGFELRITTGIDRDESAFLRMLGHGEKMQIRVGKAGRLEVGRHALGGERAAAG